MAWTTPRTWAVNEVLTAANMNTYISDDISYLGISRPHCQVRDASLSHTSSGNWVNPSWDALTTNVGSMAVSSSGYVTMPSAGFYTICVNGDIAANNTGARGLMLSSAASGGGTVYAQQVHTNAGGSFPTCLAFSIQLQCTASQTIYAAVLQSSGGTLAVTNIRMAALWEAV